jgi:hypothetical protein
MAEKAVISEQQAQWVSPKHAKLSLVPEVSLFNKAASLSKNKRTVFSNGWGIRTPNINLPISREQKLPFKMTIVDLTQSKEKKSDIFSKDWLQQEVERERKKTIPSGETPWYLLPGTGFWVKEQVAQLMRNVTSAGRDAFPTVLKREFSKVKEDTNAFEREYLKQMVNLRWNLAIGEVDGKQRITCPDYGNGTLESVTSKDEREEVVYDTLFGNKERGIVGVEEQIINAPVGTLAVMVSPEGWSGLKDAAGNHIRYPESQIYAIMKLADGKLQAYTFRYKANISQNEALQRSLGLTVHEETDQKERIKNTFKNFAIITPEDAAQSEKDGKRPIKGFKDVVDLMQKGVGGREEAYEGKTFADMHAFLEHPERFAGRHPLTEKLIQRFEDYARWRLAQGGAYKEIETDLQIALAFNPTQLGKLYREEGKVTVVDDGTGLRESIAEQKLMNFIQQHGGINYLDEAAHLQELPGCAGGSKKNIFSMGSTRPAETGNSSGDYNFDHEGTCVVCNSGPKLLGPCNICIPCDAELGGKGVALMGESKNKEELDLAA